MSEAKKSSFQDEFVSWLKERKLLMPVAFITAFVLDIMIVYGMIASPENACFGAIAIGFITPFTFIWFKTTDAKRIFIYVTVVFLILAPAYAFVFTEAVYASDPVLSSSNGVLTDGRAHPHFSDGTSTDFNFTVALSKEYVSNSTYNYTVYVNITNFETGDRINRSMMFDGNEYYMSVNLEKGVYFFYFLVKNESSNSTSWNSTDRYTGIWPAVINMDRGELMMRLLPTAFLSTFLNFALLSYIIIGMYWWTQIAKQKKKEMVTVRKPEEGDSVRCPVCGNKIPKGADKCPYCGAELIYDENEETEEKSEDETQEEGKVEGNEPEEAEG